MTFREKLADLISGGALGWERRMHTQTCSSYAETRRRYHLANLARDKAEGGKVLMGHALAEIAAQEKPTSNATVKRMARMAREALEE